MAIRNIDSFINGLWDWKFVDDLLPNKMKVTDIDGLIERKGHFMVLETKGKGVPIPLGQKIAYDKLRKTGLFTIVFLWGDPNNIEEMQVYYPTKIGEKKPATTKDFKKVLGWWINKVEG